MAEFHIKAQLESNFLTTQDAPVKARLDQCLNTDFLHLVPGKRSPSTPEGQAVAALQQALGKIKEKLLPGLPPITDAAGDYGATTIAAVRAYKSDPSHNIVRPGQPLDSLIGRGTITQIDDDLVQIESGAQPAPPAPTPTDDREPVDIYIKVFGFSNPAHQGNDISDSVVALNFANAVNRQPGYSPPRAPIKVLWFIGGQTNSCTDKVVDAVKKQKESVTQKIDRVVIGGGSAGGKNVLQIATKLVAAGVPLTFVSVWDGAFQREDLVNPAQFDDDANFDPDNPATLKVKGVPGPSPSNGSENLFQSWGHCLDKSQEVHGDVAGMTPSDLTDDSAVQAIKGALEANLIQTNQAKQDALEAAHVAVFERGERRSDIKAKEIFKP